MDGISDIRIVQIDPKRPPLIRKEPYIDLFFELTHKVPKDWGEQFNGLAAKQQFTATIKVDEGLYIESWVRTADELPANLAFLQGLVADCSKRYIAKIVLRQGEQASENSALSEGVGEQGRLNAIVALLDFDETDPSVASS